MKKENFNFYNIVWYFFIFSVLGLIIETTYCYITTGILESRKGLIFGPFCPVYGFGAIILILFLSNYKNDIIKLFLYGFILGSISEYLLSFCLDAIYGIRFWEYSYISTNLNGRICLPYSIFWGVIALFLIKFIFPLIDNLLLKLNQKFFRIFAIIIFLFLTIDSFCTLFAISVYKNKILNYKSFKNYSYLNYNSSYWVSDDFILKTFPNLRIIKKGKEIYIRDLKK